MRVYNLFENVICVVEREAEMPEAPGGDGFFGPLAHTQIAQLGPMVLVQRVQQVKVDMVDLQPPKLYVQVLVEIIGGLDLPTGHLGRQLDLVSVPTLECGAQEGLAVPAVIGIGGIHIVDAVVDGIVEHFGRLDHFYLVVLGREAHRAKPESGHFEIQFSELSIFHFYFSSNLFELSLLLVPLRPGVEPQQHGGVVLVDDRVMVLARLYDHDVARRQGVFFPVDLKFQFSLQDDESLLVIVYVPILAAGAIIGVYAHARLVKTQAAPVDELSFHDACQKVAGLTDL